MAYVESGNGKIRSLIFYRLLPIYLLTILAFMIVMHEMLLKKCEKR